MVLNHIDHVTYFDAMLRIANGKQCSLIITIPKKTVDILHLKPKEFVSIRLVPLKINNEGQDQNQVKSSQDIKEDPNIKPKSEQITPYNPISNILEDISQL